MCRIIVPRLPGSYTGPWCTIDLFGLTHLFVNIIALNLSPYIMYPTIMYPTNRHRRPVRGAAPGLAAQVRALSNPTPRTTKERTAYTTKTYPTIHTGCPTTCRGCWSA